MNPRFHHHPSFRNQTRINQRIRAPEVRVIADDGGQVGVMTTGNALKLAAEKGLDLVEVAPEARPPVCRIVDYGKYRYEQAKKHKGDSKHSHASKLKELKFHVNIGEHDYSIKLRHATDFLQKGMRVKMSLYFRGREMQHQEFGMQLMKRILQDIAALGHTDSPPRLLGKNLHMVLIPGKAKAKPAPGEVHANTVSQPAAAAAPGQHAPPQPFGNTIRIELKTPAKPA